MTIAPAILPLVRRAIIDLLADIGGEHNHETLAIMLADIGHRVASRDVADQMRWLADAGLIEIGQLSFYIVGSVTADGRDVAAGMLIVDGVSKHRTGQ